LENAAMQLRMIVLLFLSLLFKIVKTDLPSFCKCLNRCLSEHTFVLKITWRHVTC